MRNLTRYSTLYTEMININAILNHKLLKLLINNLRGGYGELLDYY